ncbi:neuronal acetylcholine receptor subunit alpha-10-like [Clytia hemisphaerica]|uniref:Uncharacterized protein n=1 Tax=Clytia hemisphaerica TaxID=252671 RepID=A0A7M6DN47_9CNID
MFGFAKINYLLINILLVNLPISYISSSRNGESRLVEDLFRNYNKEARPVLNDSTILTLNLGIALHQLIEVKEKQEYFAISLFVRQLWTDENLVWDPANYSGVETINVSPRQVWLPDLVLYNNVDEDKSFGGSLDQLNNRVIVRNDGSIKWLTPAIFRAKCGMNVEFFPFDTQICTLKFGSWTYNGFQIDLKNLTRDVDFASYSKHSEWLITDGYLRRNVVTYTCCPEPFPDVTVTLTLKRRSLFYLMNLIFPMVVISMLTMLSFYLPAESGERIALAITLLLAMTVFMLIVGEIIPPTSDSVPLVATFFSAVMLEMVLMVVILCYVLKFHFKTKEDEMPRWMRRLILDNLSYSLGIRPRSKKKEKTEETLGDKVKTVLELKSINRTNGIGTVTVVQNGVLTKHGGDINKTFENCFMHQNVDSMKDSDDNSTRYLGQKLDIFLEKLLLDEEDAKAKEEWRICAMTIDRLSLYMFGIIFVVTSLSIFLKAPEYVA